MQLERFVLNGLRVCSADGNVRYPTREEMKRERKREIEKKGRKIVFFLLSCCGLIPLLCFPPRYHLPRVSAKHQKTKKYNKTQEREREKSTDLHWRGFVFNKKNKKPWREKKGLFRREKNEIKRPGRRNRIPSGRWILLADEREVVKVASWGPQPSGAARPCWAAPDSASDSTGFYRVPPGYLGVASGCLGLWGRTPRRVGASEQLRVALIPNVHRHVAMGEGGGLGTRPAQTPKRNIFTWNR